ncbi:MAG: thioesterase family protein [Pseudorhodobacter sp.]|nr:thioesterase family protein [Pseudorhodobacter sp.]
MPLRLWRGTVLPEWLDYNGHMTEHRYLQTFGESSDALFARLGVDSLHAERGAFFTLETHIRHLKEAALGTPLWSQTQILGYDEKRLHLLHHLYGDGDALLATGEHLSIHVEHGKSCAAPEEMQIRISQHYAMGATAPAPKGVGSVLAKPMRISRLPHPPAIPARGNVPFSCVFRGNPATDSKTIRPPIPILSGH